ncbi:hypothetical protein N425_02065 [Tannerella sp. oral taxon BU063 isolate Cell 2]|uniref:Uncharacterized protein n=1 Tax=Tannerella sp. oral taxon BU063 isolate Cell 2 TaxID=1411148 RepID=W2C739_9BACT|nr:hypothetical protein N425_02065 [Tannerella sp. oral taxon BU063 isolate Cell 2]
MLPLPPIFDECVELVLIFSSLAASIKKFPVAPDGMFGMKLSKVRLFFILKICILPAAIVPVPAEVPAIFIVASTLMS